MDTFSTTALFVLSALTLAIYYIFPRHGLVSNSLEPPTAPTAIPYLGHMIGLARRKYNYYSDLSYKTKEPILTLYLPGQRMYIVNSIDLIQAIQKQHKALAFPPIEAKISSQVCGVSQDAKNRLMRNVNCEEGEWGLVHDSTVAMKTALAPGEGLDEMNRVMIGCVAASLDELVPVGENKVVVRLNEWMRDTITAATTRSVYGERNPFTDKEVQDNFWQFEKNIMAMIVGILPSITARTGTAARDRLLKAYEHYFRTGGHESASVLTKNRYDALVANGLRIDDIAGLEVLGAFAILVNTNLATFWLMFFIFSKSNLLQDIRNELGAILETTSDKDGKVIRSLDITTVKSNCPLLTSVYKECLRYRSIGTSVRQVMEDMLLDGKYHLKKDSMIQMPSRVIHMDSSVWGLDVEEFNPRRYLKEGDMRSQTTKRPPSAAFRAFGGGTTLCPGRHFATNEVLAVISMCVLRFDIKPVVGGWVLPKTDNTNPAGILMEPDTDIEVEVSPRDIFADGKWLFSLRNSKIVFAVTDEDQGT